MKPWIENIGIDEIRKGYHYDPGPNAMLIQILWLKRKLWNN